MCLSTVDFALKYEKGYWIGKGYKNIHPKQIKFKGDTFTLNNKWIEATGNYGGGGRKRDLHKRFEYGDDNKEYCPGFHIFTEEKAALGYSEEIICEVSYSDVLAFGKNITYYEGDGDAPCVISRYIRYDKILAVHRAFVINYMEIELSDFSYHNNNITYYAVVDNKLTNKEYKC